MASVSWLDPDWYKAKRPEDYGILRHTWSTEGRACLHSVREQWRKWWSKLYQIVSFKVGSRACTSHVFWWWILENENWVPTHHTAFPIKIPDWATQGHKVTLKPSFEKFKSINQWLDYTLWRLLKFTRKIMCVTFFKKLTNSSVIQNNLLMCSDLCRDFGLLQNFQMDCRRGNNWVEMVLISYEGFGIS